MRRTYILNPTRVIYTIALFAIILLRPDYGHTQDLHYSQFYNAPLSVSPGLTGIFNGDKRVTVSFRDQGRSIPVPYTTLSVGYDQKFYPKRARKGFFGAGVFFNYDKQGDSNLQLLNLNLAGSYTRKLNEKNLITIGALIGYANRAFDPDALVWDSQWDQNTNSFVGGPSGESFDFESFSFIETALGLNYRWQKSERTKFDLGVGGFHITTPSSKFYNGTDESLPLRIAMYAIFSRRMTEKLDLQLDGLYQIQQDYRESLLGAYANMYLNQERGKNRQFRVGAGYKFAAKVFFVKLGIQINEIFVAASYDMDSTDLAFQHIGASGRGPELHFRYIIKNVKPGKFKVCPIF